MRVFDDGWKTPNMALKYFWSNVVLSGFPYEVETWRSICDERFGTSVDLFIWFYVPSLRF